MSFLVALGATACNQSNTPSESDNPTPPITSIDDPNEKEEPITPIQPEKPTEPEIPVDPVTPVEPPVNPVDPITPVEPPAEPPIEPEKPVDPVTPVEPEIDYDSLTAATLTAEQKATIVNNVTTALETNIKRNIGNAGIINKVIAVDFENNYLTLLLDYNGITGDTFGLFKYTLIIYLTKP